MTLEESSRFRTVFCYWDIIAWEAKFHGTKSRTKKHGQKNSALQWRHAGAALLLGILCPIFASAGASCLEGLIVRDWRRDVSFTGLTFTSLQGRNPEVKVTGTQLGEFIHRFGSTAETRHLLTLHVSFVDRTSQGFPEACVCPYAISRLVHLHLDTRRTIIS